MLHLKPVEIFSPRVCMQLFWGLASHHEYDKLCRNHKLMLLKGMGFGLGAMNDVHTYCLIILMGQLYMRGSKALILKGCRVLVGY